MRQTSSSLDLHINQRLWLIALLYTYAFTICSSLVFIFIMITIIVIIIIVKFVSPLCCSLITREPLYS